MSDSNAPQYTDPGYCSDEHVATYAMADYPTLCPRWSALADSVDGGFDAAAPWVLTSALVDFEAQGVCPQNIVVITGPKSCFPGGEHLFAIDSVQGSSATLRRVGQPLGVGQPPALAGSVSAVAFRIPTLRPQIDDATFRIKERFSIDESEPFRGTPWIYTGVEDASPGPRVFRDAVVFETLADLYENAMRDQVENGDFARKAKRYRERANTAFGRLQVRWGPYGNAAQPTSIFGTKLTR